MNKFQFHLYFQNHILQVLGSFLLHNNYLLKDSNYYYIKCKWKHQSMFSINFHYRMLLVIRISFKNIKMVYLLKFEIYINKFLYHHLTPYDILLLGSFRLYNNFPLIYNNQYYINCKWNYHSMLNIISSHYHKLLGNIMRFKNI